MHGCLPCNYEYRQSSISFPDVDFRFPYLVIHVGLRFCFYLSLYESPFIYIVYISFLWYFKNVHHEMTLSEMEQFRNQCQEFSLMRMMSIQRKIGVSLWEASSRGVVFSVFFVVDVVVLPFLFFVCFLFIWLTDGRIKCQNQAYDSLL